MAGCHSDADPADPAGAAGAAAMPAQLVDPSGVTWEKLGPVRLSTSKMAALPAQSAFIPMDDPTESLEHLAARIRPRLETRGVEYQLSWNDALAFATLMRQPLQSGQAPGAGPDGVPLQPDASGLEGRTEGIIGTDDRTQVFSSSYPFNNVGYYSSPAGTCTVFKMINNSTSITAGHCFLDSSNHWRPAGAVTFAAGTSGALPVVPAGCYDRVTFGDAGTNASNDAGILRLHSATANCPFDSYNVGWLGWETHGACTGGIPLNTPAYPAKFPSIGAAPPGNWTEPTMFTSFNTNGHIDCIVNQNVLWIDNDVSPGESGGPAYRFDGTNRFVNGIITQSHPSGSNEALRFDSRVIGFFNGNAGS
jgi:V8-like Glu-specific endopeptidase